MSPLEFITDAADCCYNTPAGEIQEALKSNLRIHSCDKEWEILSYYYDEHTNAMVIDIQEKSDGLGRS